ncbi:MAG: hypothetical protein LUM44_08460 [Pyrinomonadaceae bacterium]|nr:hypothetical protein [Pyrinomonadaceae bacterium]
MKKQSLKLFAVALVLGIFTVLASASQAKAQQVMKFSVPFDFNFGKKELKAGEYELRALSTTNFVLTNKASEENILIVSSFDTKQVAPKDSEMVAFNRYGNTYFLSGIFVNRNQTGRGIYESKLERSIRKGENETRLAKNQIKAEKVSVSLSK